MGLSMKRIVIGLTFFFIATFFGTKFFVDRNWMQSLFAAIFQTVILFFVAKYFLKWWNKKSEEQRNQKI